MGYYYSIDIQSFDGNLSYISDYIRVAHDEGTESPILLVDEYGLYLSSENAYGRKYDARYNGFPGFSSEDRIAGFLRYPKYTDLDQRVVKYGDYIDVTTGSDKAPNITLAPLKWVGNIFREGMTYQFKDASDIQAPLYVGDDWRNEHYMPIHFTSNGVTFSSMKSVYDADNEVWTLYFGDVRVLEYSVAAEECTYINSAYRSFTFNGQAATNYSMPPITSFISFNTADITEWIGLTILSNKGDTLYNEPHLYVDNYKGYSPVQVVSDGLINTSTNEYIYKYTGNKLFQGLAADSNRERPDYAIGDTFEVADEPYLYIVESEFKHYMIGEGILKSVADAIRYHTGSTYSAYPINPSDFASEIRSISQRARIYGVDGVGQTIPALTRTDDAVGLSYACGTSEIHSDFDNCYPWCLMTEVKDSLGNVFVRIPKFYSKVTINANGTYKYQISGTKYEGFDTLFIDGKGNEIDYVLVGKYEGSGSSSHIYSKSGQTVLTSITFDVFRNGCKANGEGYQQYDFLIDAIIKQLFTIEFATTNSQSIMAGWTASDNTVALITGHTDYVKTPSGSANKNHTSDCETRNTDGHHACKYRGIENPWGNIWTWCDGISIFEGKVFICTDPTAYESAKIEAPYFYMGDTMLDHGFISAMTPCEKMPLLSRPTATGGSNTTHYCDYAYTNGHSNNVLLVGGDWDPGQHAGLWEWRGHRTASDTYMDYGGRLCYKPI